MTKTVRSRLCVNPPAAQPSLLNTIASVEQLLVARPAGDNVVLAWDGQVFEVFGFGRYWGSAVHRFHVAGRMHVDISEPDRHGNPVVAVRHGAGKSDSGVGFEVGSADLDAVRTLFAHVQAAMADRDLAAAWRLR